MEMNKREKMMLDIVKDTLECFGLKVVEIYRSPDKSSVNALVNVPCDFKKVTASLVIESGGKVIERIKLGSAPPEIRCDRCQDRGLVNNETCLVCYGKEL